MTAFANAFEKRWFWIFMVLYVFIMLPLPFFYDTDYLPSFFGVPQFIFGWLIYGLFVMFVGVLWSIACLKRPEYHKFDEDKKGE